MLCVRINPNVRARVQALGRSCRHTSTNNLKGK
jgi:hypothetical protein